jgi:bacterioferritin-associated ferredoxin
MYVCICNAVTERAVRECAKRGACTLEDLTFQLGVGAGCGRCRDCAVEVLQQVRGSGAGSGPTPIEGGPARRPNR